jgi:23S rRNA U2552 (ribose-2'-O)-methylase RlmE/FtsJ
MQTTESSIYTPFVIELPKVNGNKLELLDLDAEPSFSKYIEYPLFNLGFQHYIHATKNKMKGIEKFEKKKNIINEFEHYIDEYKESMGDVSKEFFEIGKDRPEILSRAFYKLWELITMFDLIDTKEKDFVSAHLAEGPGSFIQATMFFREFYAKNYKQDKYFAVTLHNEKELNKHVPELHKDFIDFYEKEKPQRLFIHKTYSKKIAGGKSKKDNGDLLNPKTLKNFVAGSMNGEKAHFVTADGGLNWDEENRQEQDALPLIFSQILTALKVQASGGNFVCKFFETFTTTSAKLISILSELYETVYIAKPFTSRRANSEKYIVCKNFKFEDKDAKFNKFMKSLEYIHEEMFKSNKHLVKILPEYNLTDDFINCLRHVNIYIANSQYKAINEMIIFINAQNFFGDEYQFYRRQQIEANKFWINTFFGKDFDDIKTLVKSEIKTNSGLIKKIYENVPID